MGPPPLPCLRGSSCSFQAASACFSSRLHARLMSEPSALYSRQFVQTCTHPAGVNAHNSAHIEALAMRHRAGLWPYLRLATIQGLDKMAESSTINAKLFLDTLQARDGCP